MTDFYDPEEREDRVPYDSSPQSIVGFQIESLGQSLTQVGQAFRPMVATLNGMAFPINSATFKLVEPHW